MKKLTVLYVVIFVLLLAACSPDDPTPTPEATDISPTETAVATIETTPTIEITATPSPVPTDTPHSTLSLIVSGNHNGWINTAIWLQMGDVYVVEASGVLNIWPNCEETKAEAGYPNLNCAEVTQVGPEGTMVFEPTLANYPYANGPTAALVGRVDSAPSYLVGRGGTFTAETNGFLRFAINDIVFMEDNQGHFSVLVTIPYDMPPSNLNGEWFDTGIVMAPGDTVTFAVTGAIDMWPNCEETRAERGYPNIDCAALHLLGPHGTNLFPLPDEQYAIPDANTLALVSRIGNSAAFLVGEGGTFTAETGGPLLLATNDTAFWRQDDIGVFNVAITTEDGTVTYLDVH